METAQLDPSKLDRLTSLLKADPANTRLRADCIDLALQLRRYESAALLADDGLALLPNDETLLFLKSNALIGCKNFASARTVLELLHAFDPLNQAIAQNLALCCYCVNDFGAARTHLESIYASGNRDPGVVRMLVSSCHHLGNMERATAVADENKELGRSDAALAGVFALAYLDDSRASDSAKFAAVALRGNPNNVDALLSDGTLRTASGDVERAQQSYERVLAMSPASGRAWIGLGMLDMLQRDFVKAKERLKKGLEHMPGHVGSWHALGWAYFVTGELDDAQKVFDHAMEMDRNFAETHGALGAIAAMQGNVEVADEYARVALKLDPDCMSARLVQSLLAARGGDKGRAQQAISEALGGIMSGNTESFMKMMEIAMRKRDDHKD
jgi:tetratricopeptide (TPR) repeat protein